MIGVIFMPMHFHPPLLLGCFTALLMTVYLPYQCGALTVIVTTRMMHHQHPPLLFHPHHNRHCSNTSPLSKRRRRRSKVVKYPRTGGFGGSGGDSGGDGGYGCSTISLHHHSASKVCCFPQYMAIESRMVIWLNDTF